MNKMQRNCGVRIDCSSTALVHRLCDTYLEARLDFMNVGQTPYTFCLVVKFAFKSVGM